MAMAKSHYSKEQREELLLELKSFLTDELKIIKKLIDLNEQDDIELLRELSFEMRNASGSIASIIHALADDINKHPQIL